MEKLEHAYNIYIIFSATLGNFETCIAHQTTLHNSIAFSYCFLFYFFLLPCFINLISLLKKGTKTRIKNNPIYPFRYIKGIYLFI